MMAPSLNFSRVVVVRSYLERDAAARRMTLVSGRLLAAEWSLSRFGGFD